MVHTGTMPERGGGLRVRALGVAALVLVALVVASAALPEGFPLAGRTGAIKVLTPDLPVVAGYFIIAIGALVVAAYIALRLTGPQPQPRAARKPLSVLTQVGIVLLALFLPALIIGRDRLLDRPPAQVDRSENEGGSTSAIPRERSQELGLALTVLLATLLVALSAGVTWLFWPERRKPSEKHPDRQAALDRLDAGLDDLRSIAGPRAAVIACYARMEGLLVVAGVPRRPTDTPLELLARALISLSAATQSVTILTELFERARFSDHEIDETMRARALEALSDIRAGIGAPV